MERVKQEFCGNCINPLKKLIIRTLITNFLIVIAAGHGIATLGLMEGFILSNLFNQNILKLANEILLLLLSTLVTIIGQATPLTLCL
jgi:hypothetical protein